MINEIMTTYLASVQIKMSEENFNLRDTPLAQPNEELYPVSTENIEARVVSAEHEVLKATRQKGINNAGSANVLEEDFTLGRSEEGTR